MPLPAPGLPAAPIAVRIGGSAVGILSALGAPLRASGCGGATFFPPTKLLGEALTKRR